VSRAVPSFDREATAVGAEMGRKIGAYTLDNALKPVK
jgi:hypothetical protein